MIAAWRLIYALFMFVLAGFVWLYYWGKKK
jgi:hypothetical protein